MFDASTSASHAEWEGFIQSIDFDAYHGLMGIGYIQRVPPSSTARDAMRGGQVRLTKHLTLVQDQKKLRAS